jgi:TonB family protein
MLNRPEIVLRAPRILALAFALALLLQTIPRQLAAQSKPPVPPFSMLLELKSDPQGADLNAFLRDAYKSIKDKAQATMPNIVSLGAQGVVVIQVQIQSDGNLASPAPPKILVGSGKKVLDDHATSAIRKAAPFNRLPDGTPVPLEMRVSFYYNLPPPK